jgi:hypothetical protein
MERCATDPTDVTIDTMLATEAAEIDDRIGPIVQRCVETYMAVEAGDFPQFILDLARSVYVAGLADGIHLVQDYSPALVAALHARDEREAGRADHA